jgi:hypothetical protein
VSPRKRKAPLGRGANANSYTITGPDPSTPTRRWCRCQRELHELEQWRATHGISGCWYGGVHARAHAEGWCA